VLARISARSTPDRHTRQLTEDHDVIDSVGRLPRADAADRVAVGETGVNVAALRRARPSPCARLDRPQADEGPSLNDCTRYSMLDACPAARDGDGEHISTGRYPVVNIGRAWELYSMLGVTVPGIQDHYEETGDGQRTAWLLHLDGSWARATSNADNPPVVHQAGPRRLWDTVDGIRRAWLRDGTLPVYGASVTITSYGGVRLVKGRWEATIPAAS